MRVRACGLSVDPANPPCEPKTPGCRIHSAGGASCCVVLRRVALRCAALVAGPANCPVSFALSRAGHPEGRRDGGTEGRREEDTGGGGGWVVVGGELCHAHWRVYPCVRHTWLQKCACACVCSTPRDVRSYGRADVRSCVRMAHVCVCVFVCCVCVRVLDDKKEEAVESVKAGVNTGRHGTAGHGRARQGTARQGTARQRKGVKNSAGRGSIYLSSTRQTDCKLQPERAGRQVSIHHTE